MDPTLLSYLGFVVAALILIWAAIELGRRYSRQKKTSREAPALWVQLDSTRTEDIEELLPEEVAKDEGSSEDQDEPSEPEIQIRAQQNGHFSESKKSL